MAAKERARWAAGAEQKKAACGGEDTQLSRALHLAALGYHIFPLSPGHKIPPKDMAFKERATRDAKQIRAWWKENPNYNIGIYTGRFGDDEDEALFVLDVDKKKGALGIASLAVLEAEIDLPRTAEQYTASGGFHLIYRVPIAVKQGVNVFGPGLDVRSRGGYIVGPGSIVNGVEYTWRGELRLPAPAPRDLLRRLPPETAPAAEPTNSVPLDDDASLQRAMEYARWEAEPGISGHGGNDAAYRTAAQLRSFGLSYARAVMVMLNVYNDRCIPPWPRNELLPIIQHAYQYAQNPPGVDSPVVDFGAVPVVETGKPANPVLASWFTARDAYGRVINAAKQRWRVQDVLPTHTPLVTLIGAPKTGKTLVALDLSLSVATGASWHGKRVEPAHVLYMAGEGLHNLSTRILAWLVRHGVSPDHADLSRFHVVTLLQLDTKAGANNTLNAIAVLQQRLGENFGLVVVDTLARGMTGDENAAKDMGAMIVAFDKIHQLTQGTTLVIHHCGKDPSRGGRGSNALLGALDLEILAERKDGVTKLTVTAARDQDPFSPMGFRFERQETGIYEDEISPAYSWVPVLCDDPVAAKELGAREAEALDILKKLAAKPSDGWVKAREWRDAVTDANAAESTRWSQYYRIETHLKERGRIETQGDRKDKLARPIGWTAPARCSG